MKNITLLIIGLLLLASCGPQYNISKNYSAPQDVRGQMCISQAVRQKQECQSQCNSHYNDCLADANKVSNNQYDEALYNYKQDLIRYNVKFESYNRQRDLRRMVDAYQRECQEREINCDKWRELTSAADLDPKPVRPIEPNINNFLSQHTYKCSANCGCMNEYDLQFQSCGGSISRQRICVSNCEQ